MSRRVVIFGHYLLALILSISGTLVFQAFGPGWLAALAASGHLVARPEFAATLYLIPLLLILRAHTLSDLPRLQEGLSFLLKSTFIALLALSIVDISRVETDPKRAGLVYVVDVSESMPDAALERARREVERAWHASLEQPEATRPELRVVAFAGAAEEVLLPAVEGSAKPTLPPFARLGPRADAPPPGSPKPATSADSNVPNSAGAPLAPPQRSDPSVPGTDLQGALRLALTLLPEGLPPRIVVISDGLETDGEVALEEATLTRFGVPVSWIDIGAVPRPSELVVVGLELPDALTAKIPFVATGRIEATAAHRIRCEWLLDGKVAETSEVDAPAGPSKVTAELTIPEGGDKKVALACKTLDPAADRFATNNRFELPVHVPERPKVLYVEGESRYQRNLAAALQQDFDVELRGPRGVPASLTEAETYDLIFVSDVPKIGDMGVEYLSNSQMRVLEQYARRGGGLIFAGGERSFGPGGWGQTILEREVLPVRLDAQRKQEMPGLALMLVIDRSGSMSGPKLELAKQGAIATLNALQPDDLLGICAFDSRPGELVTLQRAANRFKITDAISRLRPGGGTNIFAALDFAYNELTKADAKVKHIIVLTDGQSNRAGVLELAAQASLDRITISTVAVGVGSDQDLLQRLAESAGGNYYFTNSPESIPKLLLQETSEVTRKSFVEDMFRPRLDPRFRNLQMFRGLDMDAVPNLVGYVSTRPKPRAEVLMTSHLNEPILARWRLGLGKVVVWTSDVKNRWAHYWLAWPGYAKFWRQLVRDTLRTETEDPSYAMVTDIEGKTLTIGVDAIDDEDRFIDGVQSEVRVTDPAGVEHPVTLRQVAAGRYEGQLALGTYGPYTIRGTHRVAGSDATYRSFSTLAWPYPDEHRGAAPDVSIFERMARTTGGSRDPEPAALFDVAGAHTERRVPRWPEPLPYALGALLLDVLLRRVRLYGATEVRWL
jgi:Mg-chelatase subunit ChlD